MSPHLQAKQRNKLMAVLACLFLALPALLSGGAGHFFDLGPYVKGGHYVIGWLTDKLGETPAADGPVEATPFSAAPQGDGVVSDASDADTGDSEIKGLRSVTFSLLAYISAAMGGRFALLVALQAATAIWLLSTLFRTLDVPATPAVLLSAAVVPSIALGVSRASPDIWAGLMILALLVLLEGFRQLRLWEKVLAAAVVAAAVSFHASHLPLAAGTVLVYVSVGAFWRTELLRRRFGVALAALAIAAGAGAAVLVGFIGFGEVSVAPKRYPIALARAIEDGPALWHLEEHCDTYGYTVCEVYPDKIPGNVGAFLWDDTGVANVATAEQMDRLRAEEVIIIQRAAQEYPFAAVRRAAANVIDQLLSFSVNTGSYVRRVAYAGNGELAEPAQLQAGWRNAYHRVLNHLHDLTMTAAVLALLLLVRKPRQLTPVQIRVLTTTVLALAGNALICGVLSAPVDRYQVRVVWLLPVVLIAFHWPAIERFGRAGAARIGRRLSSYSASSS